MKERPILFSAPMVRAILAGQKTQTRRVLTPQPSAYAGAGPDGFAFMAQQGRAQRHAKAYFDAYCGARKTPENPRGQGGHWCWWDEFDRQGPDWIKCPWGVPGDQIVVRETFRLPAEYDDVKPSLVRPAAPVWYEADPDRPEGWGKTRVSIHMPRWASRITLEITGVRVERLAAISEGDAEAEGIREPSLGDLHVIDHGQPGSVARADAPPLILWEFLWKHINGDASWDANPWVWVLEFKRSEADHG